MLLSFVDNVMYSSGPTSAKNGSSDCTASVEFAAVDSRPAAKPLDQSKAPYEFEIHAYDYEEASFSNSGTLSEYTYAEVGPYKKGVSG